MNVLQPIKEIESQLKAVHNDLNSGESDRFQKKYYERFLQDTANELLPEPLKKHIRCKGVRLVRHEVSRLSVWRHITREIVCVEWELI